LLQALYKTHSLIASKNRHICIGKLLIHKAMKSSLKVTADQKTLFAVADDDVVVIE
jgi:hypothetical protein